LIKTGSFLGSFLGVEKGSKKGSKKGCFLAPSKNLIGVIWAKNGQKRCFGG
jgi:hypothetical protein